MVAVYWAGNATALSRLRYPAWPMHSWMAGLRSPVLRGIAGSDCLARLNCWGGSFDVASPEQRGLASPRLSLAVAHGPRRLGDHGAGRRLVALAGPFVRPTSRRPCTPSSGPTSFTTSPNTAPSTAATTSRSAARSRTTASRAPPSSRSCRKGPSCRRTTCWLTLDSSALENDRTKQQIAVNSSQAE